MNTILTIISSPEFWISFAFVAVILMAFRPIGRYLRAWGKRRADSIQQSLDDAKNLRAKAEALLAEYEQKTKHKDRERAGIMKRAQREAARLQKEMAEKLTERLEKQEEDMASRLRLVREQGQRELKDKMLGMLMTQTYKTALRRVANTGIDAQTDDALSAIFGILDQNAGLIKKK